MSNKEYLKAVGGNIKRIRLEKGIKQVDLAYDCDLDRQNVYRIEAGNTNPTLITLKKIAEALDVPMAELFNFKTKK